MIADRAKLYYWSELGACHHQAHDCTMILCWCYATYLITDTKCMDYIDVTLHFSYHTKPVKYPICMYGLSMHSKITAITVTYISICP